MRWVILLSIGSIAILQTAFQSKNVTQIPKAWDIERLHSMHLPYPDKTIVIQPVSEAYYYAIPERVAYKSYPLYMPGKEPAGYFEWLRHQDPQIIFDATSLKSDIDWIKAGEIVYDMPEQYNLMDSAFLASLPALGKYWDKFIHPTKEGIIPFLSIVVREKGRIELGTRSCGMCHSKLMPDGSLLKGGQGNFVFTSFFVSLMRLQRDFLKVPDSTMRKRVAGANRLIFDAPWIKHESQDRLKKLSVEEWFNSFETQPGVLHRQNSGLGFPTSVPDLFNLQNRKYFDRTGELQQRDIGDLMRYATLNQNLDRLEAYNEFTPADRPANPASGVFTRISDPQLFALANYIYSLKSPKNPAIYPTDLLNKGGLVFKEAGCVACHTPPFYSNNKLTAVNGFDPPAEHYKQYDISDINVETDPGLTLYTRRGTGYYKIPSLIGAWNRTAFLHSGNLANLEDMLDPKRLDTNYIPTGYKPLWVSHMAVPGHTYGMKLSEADKKALLCFVRSL